MIAVPPDGAVGGFDVDGGCGKAENARPVGAFSCALAGGSPP